jgi:hypothetical protein
MDGFLSLLGTLLFLGVFLLPGWIALARRRSDTLAIFLVTIFFSWTFIGWVIALVWAMWSWGSTHTNLESNSREIASGTSRGKEWGGPLGRWQTSSAPAPTVEVATQRARQGLVRVLQSRAENLTGEGIAEPPVVSPPRGEERRIEDVTAEELLSEQVAPVASPPQPDPATNAPSGIGTTARDGAWEVTLSRFGPYEEIVGQPPSDTSRTLLVAEFRITNRQRFTGTLTTSSVTLEDSRGRSTSASGQTASIEKGFWLTWLQSGQTAEHRALFELERDASPAAITITGLRFAL